MNERPYSVVFAGSANAALLKEILPGDQVRVRSRAEFITETAKPGAVAFVSDDRFHLIEFDVADVPVVGIIDDSLSLPETVRSLDSYPWLSHLIIASMLQTPFARSHVAMLLERLPNGPQRMLGTAGIGRMALLARASKRGARLDRMREFYAKQGLSERTIATICDVAEELVTNALYDAPVEAGYFKNAVPRTEDVDLPLDRACEISYGIEDGAVFVRLRDTFGALTRTRLLNVLTRCNTKSVELDESRGGAGLGLWRVFSTAQTVAITVIPGKLTDFLIGFAAKDRRVAKQLVAVDLFFVSQPPGAAVSPHRDGDFMDQSITLVRVA